ncbi:hypothetical protein PIB30_056593 [Stylosanthes scabra]|uniref:Uncharacterized protein n=1 Tax=Stylosanthes scabra TaxID=79078 RepID=A0ABU6TJ83_9FABA|nr:hypothetical protein [Stylosanthes scabra]
MRRRSLVNMPRSIVFGCHDMSETKAKCVSDFNQPFPVLSLLQFQRRSPPVVALLYNATLSFRLSDCLSQLRADGSTALPCLWLSVRASCSTALCRHFRSCLLSSVSISSKFIVI